MQVGTTYPFGLPCSAWSLTEINVHVEVSKAVIETAPIILVFQRFPLLPPCVACGLSWPKRLSESTATLQPLEMCLESLGLQTGASCHCAAKSLMANMLRDACLHSEKILNTLYKTKHIMVVWYKITTVKLEKSVSVHSSLQITLCAIGFLELLLWKMVLNKPKCEMEVRCIKALLEKKLEKKHL